jgi:hypothetical protein
MRPRNGSGGQAAAIRTATIRERTSSRPAIKAVRKRGLPRPARPRTARTARCPVAAESAMRITGERLPRTRIIERGFAGPDLSGLPGFVLRVPPGSAASAGSFPVILVDPVDIASASSSIAVIFRSSNKSHPGISRPTDRCPAAGLTNNQRIKHSGVPTSMRRRTRRRKVFSL